MSTRDAKTIETSSTISWRETRLLADRGVALCRRGELKKGFEVLAAVAETEHREAELPGAFYSYLGYGVARYQRKLSLGLSLARHAAESRFFEPENFRNLARVYLLTGNKRKAHRNLIKGLRLDPSHQALRDELTEMGRRKKPFIAFLSRSNPLNQMSGRVRYMLSGSGTRSRRTRTERAC